MDPTTIRCEKCAATWTPVPAGTSPFVCPECLHPVAAPPASVQSPAVVAEQSPPAISTTPTIDSAAKAAIDPAVATHSTEPQHVPSRELSHRKRDVAPERLRPLNDDSDIDDFDDVPPSSFQQKRRGMHPMVTLAIVLVVLLVFLPLAGIVTCLAVCWYA